MQLGRAEEAIASYRSCAKVLSNEDPVLSQEMLKAVEHCTSRWVALVCLNRMFKDMY